MSGPVPAWRRWTLLVSLVALGVGYIAAFRFFRVQSVDFIAVELGAAAHAHALANPLTSTSRLQFDAGGSGLAHLGSGWHPPDGDGATWSNWPDAWLYLATTPDVAGVTLRIEAEGYVAKRHPALDVTLIGNDVELARWSVNGDQRRLDGLVAVPAGVLARQPVALRFHVDHPASPWRLRSGADSRNLGIRLHAIDVMVAPGR